MLRNSYTQGNFLVSALICSCSMLMVLWVSSLISRNTPHSLGSPSATSKGAGMFVVICLRTRWMSRPRIDSCGPHMPRSVM